MDTTKLDQAKAALQPFLERHPYSEIGEGSPTGDWELAVKNPWGDKSLELGIDLSAPEYIEALNHCVLPERFAALWHSNTKEFEIIYTAFPRTGSQSVMAGRKMSFVYENREYECEFARSSDRLLSISAHSLPVQASTTDFRHLVSFRMYAEGKDEPGFDKWNPISFWLRSFDWDQEFAVELCRHLNFYMTYYDSSSPTIDIHAPPTQSAIVQPRTRYVTGSFPSHVVGHALNSSLMHFWSAARSGDNFRRFLYYYQILEYAGFYYIDSEIVRSLRRQLAAPHMFAQIDQFISTILDEMSERKVWEGAKIERLVKDTVDPSLIWREIQNNSPYFKQSRVFEGGCTVAALIAQAETEEVFKNNWQVKFCKSLRDIRNALSHGKEQVMSSVITPTPNNIQSLEPWVSLISVTAGEVMLYRTATL